MTTLILKILFGFHIAFERQKLAICARAQIKITLLSIY